MRTCAGCRACALTTSARTRCSSTTCPGSRCSSRAAPRLAALEQVIPDSRHAPTIARLRCFRGLDTLGCWAMRRDRRLAALPAQALAGFLGIVPTEHTSTQAPAGLDHQGRVHARRLLVRLPTTITTDPPSGTPRPPPGRPRPGRSESPRAQRRCTGAGACASSAASRRRGRDRVRPRARRVLLGGRHTGLAPPTTTALRCCRISAWHRRRTAEPAAPPREPRTAPADPERLHASYRLPT